jgi:MoxR-like ATPase
MTNSEEFVEVPSPELVEARLGSKVHDAQDHELASTYRASTGLAAAVNTALILRKPLLLMGPPGTGKTELARAVAWQLDLPLYRFETKSSNQSRDLFYTYDSLRAFRTEGTGVDHRNYIEFQALGRAILDALPGDQPDRVKLAGEAASGHKPHRSVVLIDEIDKAPRDFPNDILNEIEHFYFKVPELNNIESPPIPDELRPVVIITSNDERGLPAAFLRRCLFFHIPFPDEAQMRTIVAARLGQVFAAALGRKIDAASLPRAVDDLIVRFGQIRQDLAATGMQPATAELLEWIRYLAQRGLKLDTPIGDQPEVLAHSETILGKNEAALTNVAQALRKSPAG